MSRPVVAWALRAYACRCGCTSWHPLGGAEPASTPVPASCPHRAAVLRVLSPLPPASSTGASRGGVHRPSLAVTSSWGAACWRRAPRRCSTPSPCITHPLPLNVRRGPLPLRAAGRAPVLFLPRGGSHGCYAWAPPCRPLRGVVPQTRVASSSVSDRRPVRVPVCLVPPRGAW